MAMFVTEEMGSRSITRRRTNISGTHETRAAMTALTRQNLDALLADGNVLTPVL
ncbi:hypothetical protein [Cupriavidus sp. AcVe19-6a]|uniref:hypothetical protein n=1 Tax=Cupriavidus sp. AcVe19-6a TaxID=2821358 RepID=UPI001FD79416|nr:hypothetical protein [Cupriavidus sp. AcVe19-6a]